MGDDINEFRIDETNKGNPTSKVIESTLTKSPSLTFLLNLPNPLKSATIFKIYVYVTIGFIYNLSPFKEDKYTMDPG